MIKNVIFDLSDVLITGLKGIDTHLQKIKQSELSDINWLDNNLKKYFYGNQTEERYWINFIKLNNLSYNVSDLEKAFRVNIREIEGTRNLINELHKRGIKLGLLSDHGREWIDYCESKFLYQSLFDSVMYSFNYQMTKENPSFFEVMLKTLKAESNDTIMIDDSDSNLSVASNIGIEGIKFIDSFQVKKSLKNKNII